jgi:hypothetical protein
VPLTEIRLGRPQSDRVMRLTAACIRAAVRLEHGHEMSMDDALDLARIYSVPAAVAAVRAKMDLLRAVMNPVRVKLAIGEAKLAGGLTGEDHLSRIIEIRRASLDFVDDTGKGGQQREAVMAALREVRKEWNSWASEYLGFVSALSSLHAQGTRELQALRLDPEDARQAEIGLERIMLAALSRASESDSIAEEVA